MLVSRTGFSGSKNPILVSYESLNGLHDQLEPNEKFTIEPFSIFPLNLALSGNNHLFVFLSSLDHVD